LLYSKFDPLDGDDFDDLPNFDGPTIF